MNDFSKQQQFIEKQSKNKQQSSDDQDIKEKQISPKNRKQAAFDNQISKCSQIQKIKQYISFMFTNSNSPSHQNSSQKDQTQSNEAFSLRYSSHIKNLQQKLLKYTKITQIQNQQQFQNFFTNFNIEYKIYQQSVKLLINQKITKSKRFSISNKFNKQIQVKKIYHSKHYEIVSVKIQLLEYETEIRILNELQKSSLHTCAKISCYGGFGNIYFVKVFDQMLAIKCIPFNKTNNWIQTTYESKSYMKDFISILKQYFFNLLFSQLEIGPKIKTIGGFDLIFNQSCVQFASQICENAQIGDRTQFQQDLKQSLKIYHSLKIVHRDIKPTNIMYSNKFNKNVFIDFGVSQVIQETVGYKTISSFIGTTSHCTEQLFSLIHNIKGHADLYFNDVFALKRSISDFVQAQKQGSKINYSQVSSQQITISQNSLYILIYTLKHKLYYSPLNKTSHLISQQQSEQLTFLFKLINIQINKETGKSLTKDQIDIKILQFFYQLNTINSVVIKYFEEEIQQYIQQLDQLVNLKKFIRNYSERELFVYYTNQSKKNMFLFFQWFYQLLFVEYNDQLEDSQKFILIMVNNKKLMEEYVQKCLGKFNQLFLDEQSLLKNNDFHVLCILLSKYLTLTNNKFGIEMDKKLIVCQDFMKKLRRNKHALKISIQNKKNQVELQLIFKCIQKRFQPLAIFFQFFLLHLWKSINFKNFNSQVFLQSLINLCLLGYPTYSKQGRHHMMQLVLNNRNLQKPQQIILYWQVKILFITFDTYFHQKSQQNFYLQRQDKQNNEYFNSKRHYEMQTSQFLPQKNQKNNNITLKDRFITINYQFYQKINFNHNDVAYKRMFNQLRQYIKQQNFITHSFYQKQALQSSHFLPIPKSHVKPIPSHNLKQQLIKKWLILTYYILYILNLNNFRLNLETNNSYINEQLNALIIQYSRQIYNKKQTNFYYFLILSALQTVIQTPNSIKTNLYLQKLFNKINQPTISLRLFVLYQFNIILMKQIPQKSIQKFIQILNDFQSKFSHMNYYQINNLLEKINLDRFFNNFGTKIELKLQQEIENASQYGDNLKKYNLRKLYLSLYYKIFTIALEYAVYMREKQQKKSNLPTQLKQYKIYNIDRLQRQFQQLKFQKRFFIKLIELGQKFLIYKQKYPTLMTTIFIQQKHAQYFNQLRKIKLKYYHSLTYFYEKIINLQQVQNILKIDQIHLFNKILEEVLKQHEDLHRNFIGINPSELKNQKQNSAQLAILDFFEQFSNLQIINSEIFNIDVENQDQDQDQEKEKNSLESFNFSKYGCSCIKLPSIALIIQYYEYKLIKSNYHTSQCRKFFKLIKFLKHKKLLNTYLFKKSNLLQQILFVYILLYIYSKKMCIYQNSTQNQIKSRKYFNVKHYEDLVLLKITDLRQILQHTTKIIKNMPSIINIELLRQNIQMIFSIKAPAKNQVNQFQLTSHENKISNQNGNQLNQESQQLINREQFQYTSLIKHWKPFDLIKQLYHSIQCLDYCSLNEFISENQYMALVYCFCYTNNLIPYKMSKLFLKVIRKSLQYLDKYSKNLIQNRIYQTILVTLINQQKQVYLTPSPNQPRHIDPYTHYLNLLKLRRQKRHILITKIFRRQKQHFISKNELRKMVLSQTQVEKNNLIYLDSKINRYLQNSKNIQ